MESVWDALVKPGITHPKEARERENNPDAGQTLLKMKANPLREVEYCFANFD